MVGPVFIRETDDFAGRFNELLIHNQETAVTAAKQEYNSSQMFHILDEAEERGEQMAKAAEKYKPKTEEERKEEAVDEALGTDDDKGMLADTVKDAAKVKELVDKYFYCG